MRDVVSFFPHPLIRRRPCLPGLVDTPVRMNTTCLTHSLAPAFAACSSCARPSRPSRRELRPEERNPEHPGHEHTGSIPTHAIERSEDRLRLARSRVRPTTGSRPEPAHGPEARFPRDCGVEAEAEDVKEYPSSPIPSPPYDIVRSRRLRRSTRCTSPRLRCKSLRHSSAARVGTGRRRHGLVRPFDGLRGGTHDVFASRMACATTAGGERCDHHGQTREATKGTARL